MDIVEGGLLWSTNTTPPSKTDLVPLPLQSIWQGFSKHKCLLGNIFIVGQRQYGWVLILTFELSVAVFVVRSSLTLCQHHSRSWGLETEENVGQVE